MNNLRHLRTIGLWLPFFMAPTCQAEGLKMKPEVWFPVEAKQNDTVPSLPFSTRAENEMKMSVAQIADTRTTASITPTEREGRPWRLSDYIRSVGIDIYTGSTHEASEDRGKPVEEGGLNEENDGRAVVVTLNVKSLCVWTDTCVNIIHDTYRTEFYVKFWGIIDNSQNGSANHYGLGFQSLYTPSITENYKLLAGIGAERLRLKYCVPKYDACAEGFVSIPFATVGLEYSSKGLRILFAPMKYLIPKGDAGKTRVKLNAYRASAEIAFWGI